MRCFLILIFFFNLALVEGQVVVSGTVTDSTGVVGVERASVYINGTTKLTYTDKEGRFKLENVVMPCQLIISHLNFQLKSIGLEESASRDILIKLHSKEIKLNDVTVKGTSSRESNVEIFRNLFLGNDEWGKNAVLLNDSVLYFSRQNDTLFVKSTHKNSLTSDSSKVITNPEKEKGLMITHKVFAAITRAPLQVDLKLLGYLLSIDIVRYIHETEGLKTKSVLLGYFNFKPDEVSAPRKQRRYEKNREKIYYNSSLHFLRALLNKSLSEQGYVIVKMDSVDARNQQHYSYVHLDSLLDFTENHNAIIRKQKEQTYFIYYFSDSRGYPMSLKNFSKNGILNLTAQQLVAKMEGSGKSNKSTISFLSDECLIRLNGTIPDNNIAFGGQMSRKKVSVLLPDDYESILK